MREIDVQDEQEDDRESILMYPGSQDSVEAVDEAMIHGLAIRVVQASQRRTAKFVHSPGRATHRSERACVLQYEGM